jgi:Rod binding domain-containing protein
MIDPTSPRVPGLSATARADLLRTRAQELEAAFLSEMLAHAGLDGDGSGFGGGIGEAQFGSFLRQAQAEAIVRAGGIGLSESLFRAMAGDGT